jgi:hypothetical protein
MRFGRHWITNFRRARQPRQGVLRNLSWIERCTRSRDPAMQVCPVAAKIPEIAPMTGGFKIGIFKNDIGGFPTKF